MQLAEPSNVVKMPLGLPKRVFQLRWRLTATDGTVIRSDWTPEVRFPSIRLVMQEFGDRIAEVAIEGKGFKANGGVFLRADGPLVKGISYKFMGSLNGGKPEVIGIQLDDVTGRTYLVMRDGNVILEEKRS